MAEQSPYLSRLLEMRHHLIGPHNLHLRNKD
ncbi:MAG: hypothetical protein ACI8R9_001666 [Paraglaciecola sp.]|jgi:hypothetical protein